MHSRARTWLGSGLVGIAVAVIAYPFVFPAPPLFPDAIDYSGRNLTKATAWTRGGVSGAVYVSPGEKLPAAPLQVRVMVSTDHRTAADLDGWIRSEYDRSRTQHLYDSDVGEVSCKAGLASYGHDARTFMAVQVCATGGEKAACAESDESLPDSILAPCLNGPSSCFADACAMRERADAGFLASLVSTALAKEGH